jgi:hypothetical protein
VKARYWLQALVLIATVPALSPATARAQLPFEVTRSDLAKVDTLQLRWPSLRASVGGVSGALQYAVEDPEEAECRAVAVLGMLRLRNHYLMQYGERPVTLKLQLRCGPVYHGRVEYDGINTRFELREGPIGRVVYRGQVRGLP